MTSHSPPPKSTPKPKPAYLPSSPDSPLNADTELYNRIAAAPRRLLFSQVVPIRSGFAWHVRPGQICRLTTPEGPQVGDLNMWNAYNPRERFWAARTRQLQRSHVSVGDRLWSCLPYLRPMVTITADSLKDFGTDEWGGRCHDLLGTRCDPYVNSLLTSTSFDYHCHSNLTRAVLPLGLNESDVHDVLNVFQVTGLNEEGRYFMQPSPAKKDDFFEFFAEIDLLCAISTCPGGDLSAFAWGESSSQAGTPSMQPSEDLDSAMLKTCRPLGVEVYELLNPDDILKDWKPPEAAVQMYGGLHGMKMPMWAEKKH